MRPFLSLLLFLVPFTAFAQKNLKVWYGQPANVWTEALPIGNGRIGAMIFGRTDREILQLNEESVWAGSKTNNNNKETAKYLPEIRQAIFDNELDRAKELASRYMVGTPPQIRSYQPLGNLFIDYNWKGTLVNYTRSLDLNTGINRTSYLMDSNAVSQKVYASAVNDAIFLEIEAKQPISFSFGLNREIDVDEYRVKGDIAYYNGQITDLESKNQGPGGKHIKFNASVKIVFCDGEYSPLQRDSLVGFSVKNVRKLIIAITGATDFNLKKLDFDRTINPQLVSENLLNKIQERDYEAIAKKHLKEYQSLFNRVDLDLKGLNYDAIPTDQRLKNFRNGAEDHDLIALFYQYGRYLLMSSSRAPGRLPANLQGIWNKDYKAAWNSDFHTNINLQMNYWPAESGNLPETSIVLSNFMKQLTVPGAETAKEMYGARGWTLHHLTDLFGRTGVADGVWGVSPMNGPWMTFPLYEHYEFTRDLAYLRHTAYPILKGSVEWVVDFLVRSPEGLWVTNPSHSPENAFFAETAKGKIKSELTYAATIDIQIIHQLFDNFKKASKILNLDVTLRNQISKIESELPLLKIAKNGTIQEWIKDYEEVEPGHRHISHLLGLYPANSINPNTADLYEAAKKTIKRRLSNGGGHTGWSKAWIINFYARLLDGELAYQNVRDLLGKTALPNLFSTHPPFQIDGNFGGAAGIAEMLLQSQNNEIHILPAVPKAWSSGSFKGLKARGGLTLNLIWENNEIKDLQIVSPEDQKLRVVYKDQRIEVNIKKGKNKIDARLRSQ